MFAQTSDTALADRAAIKPALPDKQTPFRVSRKHIDARYALLYRIVPYYNFILLNTQYNTLLECIWSVTAIILPAAPTKKPRPLLWYQHWYTVSC